jgi:hypothetical protein
VVTAPNLGQPMAQQTLAGVVASNASRPCLRIPIQLLISTAGYIEFCLLHHWFTFLQLLFGLVLATFASWFAKSETELTVKNAWKHLFTWCVCPYLLTTIAIVLTLILVLALLPNDAFSH